MIGLPTAPLYSHYLRAAFASGAAQFALRVHATGAVTAPVIKTVLGGGVVLVFAGALYAAKYDDHAFINGIHVLTHAFR